MKYARTASASTPTTTPTIMPVRMFSGDNLELGRLDGQGRVDGMFGEESVV